MTAGAHAFRILTTGDREAIAPKEWVVEGLLGAGEVSALIAPPTAGKSVLALDLAATIASGLRWFDRATVAGAALYFAPERGAVTLRRLRAFEQHHQIERLQVGVVRDALDLIRSDRDVERVLATVRAFEERAAERVRLVVIDTVRAAMPAGDENSPRDMSALSHHVGKIRDGCSAHILLIHHTPKDRPEIASGHTSLGAMIDTTIVISESKGVRRWRVSEVNDLPSKPPPAEFKLEAVTIGRDALGAPMTAPIVVPVARVVEHGTTSSTPDRPLPKDAQLAFDALKQLGGVGSTIEIEVWRPEAYRAFGERSGDTKRRAFHTAKDNLARRGLIALNGNTVSVSAP